MAAIEQFTGMDMEQLVAAPLVAACDAQVQLARSTAGFIQQVGVDEQGKTRTASFLYQQEEPEETMQEKRQSMRVEVPLLAMVPVPNLQIDEVGLTFDMEVRQSERKETEMQAGGNLEGGIGFGPAKVSMRGTVSSHSQHTRESDYSAKYHLEIRAANHGTPEALERVRDLMLTGIVPVPVKNVVVEKQKSAVSANTKNAEKN